MKRVAPLGITVLSVGKGRDRLLAELADRYLERLARLADVTVRHVPAAEGKGRSPGEGRALEGRRLAEVLNRTGDSARWAVVALDETGREVTSRGLAETLTDLARRGKQEACFVIGGDEGQDPGVLARADLVLSLSRLTFTHEMARVILLEQLYRAHAILAGHPYHRD